MSENPKINGRIDLDKPRWDQSTFYGRLKYFASITNCRHALVSTDTLNDAKDLIEKYRLGVEPPGTTDEQVHFARQLYGSAFHPDTGELQNVIGRMTFQVPGGMIITAAMLHFYKTTGGIVSTQWVNQSFNALVNYTNRNAGAALSNTQIGIIYASATTSALIVALGLKSFLSSRASPLFQRFVPFIAVASANCVNIPLTRQDELKNGVSLVDDNNNSVVKSKYAASRGISQVVFSRLVMAAPGMVVLPLMMERLERRPWFHTRSYLHLPFQTFMLGIFLEVLVPVGCAIFPQRSSIQTIRLKEKEPEIYGQLEKFYGDNMPQTLYFNKGL